MATTLMLQIWPLLFLTDFDAAASLAPVKERWKTADISIKGNQKYLLNLRRRIGLKRAR